MIIIGVTEDINKAIKATACTITKSRLSDKIRSDVLLQRAGLKCLNEAVACITVKKKLMDPLGQRLFQETSAYSVEGPLYPRMCVLLSQDIIHHPPTSWQKSGTLFQDSKMPLLWELQEHSPRNGQRKSPDELQLHLYLKPNPNEHQV